MSEVGEREVASARRIGAAATLLAVSVLLSRILGFGREALIAALVGAGSEADAYQAAFMLPDFLNYLLAGGALSIAFLPRYSALREREGEEAADRLLGIVLGTLGAVAIVVTAVAWCFATPLLARLVPGFDVERLALTVSLVRIILPAQIFFLAGGIVNAALFARGRFGAAALSPLIYNGGIILGGVVLGPRLGVHGFAWGVLLGAVLGPFAVPLLDCRGRVRVRPRVRPLDPGFATYLKVAAPLMLGQSLLTLDDWYKTYFGAGLGSGVVAQLGYARKLMQLPVAMVGQAVATAALPVMVQLWAQGRADELNRLVTRTLRAGLTGAVLGGALFVALAHPIVATLYRHGKFTAGDATVVSALLAVYALAVPAWIVQQLAVRAFYARGDTLRPMVLGTVVALAAIPLYVWASRSWGASGIAGAGVVGMSVNAALTIAMAWRVHQAPAIAELLGSLARALAIASVAGLGAFAVADATVWLTLPPWVGAASRLASGALTFAALAAFGAVVAGDDAMKRLLRLPRRVPRG